MLRSNTSDEKLRIGTDEQSVQLRFVRMLSSSMLNDESCLDDRR